MKYVVLSESSRRIRIKAASHSLSFEEADRLEYFLRSVPGVKDVKVHERTGNAVIFTDGRPKDALFLALSHYDRKTAVNVPVHTGRALYHELEDKIFKEAAGRVVRLILPMPARNVLTVSRGVPKIVAGMRRGIGSGGFAAAGRAAAGKAGLAAGAGAAAGTGGPADAARGAAAESRAAEKTGAAQPKESPLTLRNAAVVVSLLTGQIGTASSLMFADRMGTILKEWTLRQQADLLAEQIQTGDEKVWVLSEDGKEMELEAKDLKGGERIRLRTGDLTPVDGVVDSGQAEVDQAELTGDHELLTKTEGSYLYAGSVINSGECVLIVEKTAGEGRYDRIVRMLRDSGRLTPGIESFRGKDTRLVSGAFLTSGMLTGLITRDPSRMLPFMLVDFTHTMNTVLPAAVIGAMREAGENGIVVKNGPALLKLCQADTILFNKRGILTAGKPKVVRVDTFNGFDENDVLATAACLEEHFPHSMADAVVEEARKRDLFHEERHTRVEYVASHGIASTLDGERVVIGSKHFVVDDEGVPVPEEEMDKYLALLKTHSHLYMAVGGRLAAVISLEDPIRQDVPETIRELRDAGFTRIVLMTGDSEHAARKAAESAGFDAYYSGVSAEEKETFIEKERQEGRVSVMVGDGINDVPALRAADVGIALETSVPLAAKNADILIPEGDLKAILKLRTLSEAIGRRVRNTGKVVVPVSTGLGILGSAGVLSTNVTALSISGMSFLAVLHGMTNLVDRKTVFPDMRSAAAVLMARSMAKKPDGDNEKNSQKILSELGVLPS